MVERSPLNRILAAANERIGKEDWKLARHSVKCLSEADWENTKVATNECGLRQRKVKEEIDSSMHCG